MTAVTGITRVGSHGESVVIKVLSNGDGTYSETVTTGGTGTAGDGTVTTGGTAQTLFAGATPVHGWAVYNPDPSEMLFVTDAATATINGGIPVPPQGGYETPSGYRPVGPISLIGATSGHKFSARSW